LTATLATRRFGVPGERLNQAPAERGSRALFQRFSNATDIRSFAIDGGLVSANTDVSPLERRLLPGKSGMYVGQSGLFACTVDGRRHGIPARVPALIGEIGATAGGITAWTNTNAVRGAPTSAERSVGGTSATASRA
jgi:hypothetical protein